MGVIMPILGSIGKSLIAAFLTEKFIKDLIVFLLEKLAKLTSNNVDDELVAKVKEALHPSQEPKR
jgi:spore cortex formation protein SpoVR/YcgB (stage V sporulation)